MLINSKQAEEQAILNLAYSVCAAVRTAPKACGIDHMDTARVITTDRVRAYLAAQACADVTCPLTAGIFTNICAYASEERAEDKIPWWRALKAKGELNEKYPEGQRLHLEMEGHTVIQKGKRYFVEDFEKKLFNLDDIK